MPLSPLPSKVFALPGREEAVRPEVREDAVFSEKVLSCAWKTQSTERESSSDPTAPVH